MSDLTDEQALDLAIQHQQAGRLVDAEAIYRRLLAAHPDNPDLLHLMGIVAFQVKRFDVAEQLFRRAIAINSGSPHYHASLGKVFRETNRPAEAIVTFERAAAIQKDNPDIWESLGGLLIDAGRIDEGIAAYRKAMSLSATPAEVGNNLSAALLRAGKVDSAIAILEETLLLAPDLPHTHYNLAQALLLKGDFARGWREHEWRRKVHDRGVFCQDFPQPMWDGSALNGQTLLLHAEQGFGDTIQFARYLPQVAQRAAGRVIVQVPIELERLLGQLKDAQIVARGQPLPEFDRHCPLMSLSTLFETIPAEVPYLQADPEIASRWRSRLPTGVRNIGICWKGRPTHTNDRNRSIAVSELTPLRDIPKANFISHQKRLTPAAGESPTWMSDWTEELQDFADAAALIDNFDLIITVDTAVAHLAGAMGKPVWLLLPFMPDWRWMLDRHDSPWYPTMRLFRQKERGDWKSVIARVVSELITAAPL